MKTKKDLKVLGIAAAVLLFIAAVGDMEISRMIYNPESLFGKALEAVGEFPAMFIGAFCTMTIGVVQKKGNNGKMNMKSVLGFFFGILLALTAGNLPVKYLEGPEALGVVLGLGIAVADYFMISAIAETHGKELYKAAVFGLQLFLLVVLTFNLIKMGWGRERYRHMMETGDFSGFSPWFLPRGFTTENEFMSFPSGHSANAAVTMWITLLPTFLPSLKTKEALLKILSCVWIALVMVSRVIMGAHFLGDVAMGMTLSLVIFYLLYQKKYVKEK